MRFVLGRMCFYFGVAWASLTLGFLATGARVLYTSPDAVSHAHQPFWSRYFQYLLRVSHGDLGISIAYFPTPVQDVIGQGFAGTMLLAAVTVPISIALGGLLGIVGAWPHGGRVHSIRHPNFTAVVVFPGFLVAMVAVFILGLQMGRVPLNPDEGDPFAPTAGAPLDFDVLRRLALPAAAAVLTSTGGWALAMRSTMAATLAEDYVTLAEAKGLPQRRILLNYAVRNALLPGVNSFGAALGFVLASQLLIEIVLAYPGLGPISLQAVRSQDQPLILGMLLSVVFTVMAVSLLGDVVYVWLDPRVRHRVASDSVRIAGR